MEVLTQNQTLIKHPCVAEKQRLLETLIMLKIYITIHSWNPPPHPLLKGDYNLPKIESLGGGGVRNFLLERGDKPVKGDWCRNGRLSLFYYFTVQSYLPCVRGT